MFVILEEKIEKECEKMAVFRKDYIQLALKREALLIVSFLLFSFSQPDISPLCCIFCSAFGFSLFWKSVSFFKKKNSRFFLGFFWFALGSYPHLSWFVANRYGGDFFFLVLVGILFFLGLFFALFTLFIPAPSQLTLLSILGLSGLWTISEWGRLFFLSGYSWDPVGLMLSATVKGMQFVSLLGIYGLTFWIFFTNLLGLKVLSSKKIMTFFLWIAASLLPYLYGSAAISYHKGREAKTHSPSLSILLVQTALLPEKKLPFDSTVEALSPIDQCERILALLKNYKREKIDLIVFPEGALPYPVEGPLYSVDEMKNLFARTHLELPSLVDLKDEKATNASFAHALSDLFGSDLIMGLEDYQDKEAYNAAFFFQPNQPGQVRYEKRILLPMAEYIPSSFCKKFLSYYYGIEDCFTPGKETKIFNGKVPIAVSICSEETFGSLLKESRQKGAKLFVNITNDGWYPRSRLPIVHFLHGRLRAVEEGIPLVRACNTGVTSGVNSLGECVGFLDFDAPNSESSAGVLHLNLSVYHYTTLYSKLGNEGIIIPSFAFFILFITKNRHSLRKKEK